MSYAQVTTSNSRINDRKRPQIAENDRKRPKTTENSRKRPQTTAITTANDRNSSVTCQIVLLIIKQSSYTLIKVRVYALCFIKDVIFFFRLLLGLCSRFSQLHHAEWLFPFWKQPRPYPTLPHQRCSLNACL